MFATAKVNKKY